jgi:hypothetical protein
VGLFQSVGVKYQQTFEAEPFLNATQLQRFEVGRHEYPKRRIGDCEISHK